MRRVKVYYIEIKGIIQVPLAQRGTIRDTAAAIHMPKSTLHECLKSGNMRAHSSYLNLTLTADNCQKRVNFLVVPHRHGV